MRASRLTAVAVLALVAGLVFVLSTSHTQRTGVNQVPADAYVESLAPSQVACQAVTLPSGTRNLGVYVGVYHRPGPRLETSMHSATKSLGSSVTAGGYRSGALQIDIPHVPSSTAITACIRNVGQSRVALGGVPAGAGASTVDGQPRDAALEISYLGPHTSYWAFGPLVARRVGLLDFGGTGAWLFWVLVALMIFAGAAAVALVTREVRH